MLSGDILRHARQCRFLSVRHQSFFKLKPATLAPPQPPTCPRSQASKLLCGSTVDFQLFPSGAATRQQLNYLTQPSWLGQTAQGEVCQAAVAGAGK